MALDFKIDREPKGILCIPYTIVAPNTTPGKGRISFGPTKFVDNITKINIHKTTNLDVDLEGLLEVSTSGVVTIYDRTNPDIYVIFKYSSITDQGNFVEFIIDGSTNLSTSKRQPFQEGTQVCILFTGSGGGGGEGTTSGTSGTSGLTGSSGTSGTSGSSGTSGTSGRSGVLRFLICAFFSFLLKDPDTQMTCKHPKFGLILYAINTSFVSSLLFYLYFAQRHRGTSCLGSERPGG